MKIENIALDALIPYARNSRTHSEEQVAQVAASIKEFGFTNPVLIDEQGGIIAGHGRTMAARKLGLASVPCIRLSHLSEAQKRAYVIADNKLALNAGWDEKMLAIEFKELQDIGFDIELTGFAMDDIDELLAELDATPEGNTEADETPQVQAEVISKPGDIFLLGKHRVMCGDSTSIHVVERLMEGKKAAMVFTDPPYGVDYEGINNDSRSGLAELLDRAFANYAAISKPGAAVYVFHSDRCADIFHEAFRRYCHFSSMVIWVKPSLVLSQTDYQSQHEPCLYGWIEGGTHSWNSDRKQTSVWNFSNESVEGHTTPKPVELIAYAIENSSKNGQIVVDLFGGSGSTLIACETTGRINRSMELDPKYVDVIVRRWQQYTGRRATHAVTGQEFGE